MSILQAPKFDKVKQRRKVSIFIDEASEVVNEALLQLLNKARGADFSITIATQTFSDLAKRCGSKDAAMQLIGNCNTMYALRVKMKRQHLSSPLLYLIPLSIPRTFLQAQCLIPIKRITKTQPL